MVGHFLVGFGVFVGTFPQGRGCSTGRISTGSDYRSRNCVSIFATFIIFRFILPFLQPSFVVNLGNHVFLHALIDC